MIFIKKNTEKKSEKESVGAKLQNLAHFHFMKVRLSLSPNIKRSKLNITHTVVSSFQPQAAAATSIPI